MTKTEMIELMGENILNLFIHKLENEIMKTEKKELEE